MSKAEQFMEEEIRRACKNGYSKNVTSLKKQIRKYKANFEAIEWEGRSAYVCTLTGSKGGVVSTGVAWLSPQDTWDESIGRKISYSRAIRNLVGKRLGVTS